MLRSATLILLLPATLGAQEVRRPLTLDDYYSLEQLSAPAMSPDGRWVAFVRTRVLEAENRRHSEVWLVASDGSSAARRLSPAGTGASDPRWSPDGVLSYQATRRAGTGEATSPVWFVRPEDPERPFQLPGVTEPPVFSPDNKWIAFTRATPPAGTPPNAAQRSESERRIAERFRGRATEWLDYRFDGRGYLPDPRDPWATPARELYIVPRAGGTPRRLTTLGVDVRDVAWSPDAGRLAFVADSSQRDEYVYERADVYIADLDGGVRRLTNDGYDHDSPVWTRDGREIVVRRRLGLSAVIATGQSHGAPVDLYRLDAARGTLVNLTEAWDLIPGAPRMGRDAVLFEAGSGGDNHVFALSLADGRMRQLTSGARRLSGVSHAADFARMTYVASAAMQPPELFVAGADGAGERRLTDFHDALLRTRVLAPARLLRFTSNDGTQVEGWFMRPPHEDSLARVPLILAIHGGPHSAYGSDFNFQFQLWAASGYAVLFTNPRGSTGYGEKFLWATWGGGWGVQDYEDVMAGVGHVLRRERVDSARLAVTGYSYGGFLSNWIITQTPRFAAAVVGAGISNWISDYATADIPRTKESEFFGAPWEPRARALLERQSPVYYAGAVVTPTLFIHGEADLRVPIEQAEQMYIALRKRRVPARFVRYPDMYHGGWTPWNMVHRYHEELLWWARYLAPRVTQ